MTAGNFTTLDGITLTVRFDDQETVADVDANGDFAVYGGIDIPYGIYTVCVKEKRCLELCQENVVIPSTDPPVYFGDLISGDADDNNSIGFNDSLLLGTYWYTAFHPANFDNSGDGLIGIQDLLALAANWTEWSAPTPMTPSAEGTLTTYFEPSSITVMGAGEEFSIDLWVEASVMHPVRGTSAYILYDPGILAVMSLTDGCLDVHFDTFDNDAGTIAINANILGPSLQESPCAVRNITFRKHGPGFTEVVFQDACIAAGPGPDCYTTLTHDVPVIDY